MDSFPHIPRVNAPVPHISVLCGCSEQSTYVFRLC